jgi:hypothetical protein
MPYRSAILDLELEGLCRWAFNAAFVSHNGSCLACCEQMIDLPRRTWAVLGTQPFSELWNGELLWAYRFPLSVGLIPAGCEGCPQAPPGGRPLSQLTPAHSPKIALSVLQ